MDALNSMTIYPDPRYILLNGRHAYPRIITNPVYNDELGVAFMVFMPPSFLCFNIMFDNVRTWRSICLSGVGGGLTPNGNSTLVDCGPFILATGLSSRLPPKLLDGNWTLVPFAFRNLHECIWAIALVRIRTVVYLATGF